VLPRIRLDKRNPLPLYAQLQVALRAAILTGELPAGTALPSEEKIGASYGLSRLTVRRALQDLQREGLVRTERGRPSVVGEPARPPGNDVYLIMAHLHEIWHVDLIRGAEQQVKRHGARLVLRNSSNDPTEEARELADAVGHGAAAILLFPAAGFRNSAPIRGVLERGIPLAFVHRYYPDVPADVVAIDHLHGTCLATSHLIGLGHSRIAFLNTLVYDSTSIHEGLAGYRRALDEAGLAYDPRLVIPVTPTYGGPHHPPPESAAIVGLTQPPHAATAFVGCEDMTALTAMQVVREAGLRVPEDVAITGFNDTVLAATADPPLTSVARPWEETGRRAAELVLDRWSQPAAALRRELMPVRLVVRQSSAGAAAGRDQEGGGAEAASIPGRP
jgi:GntR family transcriptional regulator of arabinose operon